VSKVDSVDLRELFKEIVEYSPRTATIAVLGKMRTGKTTLALKFANFIKQYYNKYDTSIMFFNT